MENIKKQTLDYSCGAAALSILLTDYFEDEIDEITVLDNIVFHLSDEEIKERIVEGFSMLDLKKTAEGLGYTADGVMLPHESITALKGPVIILLRRVKTNHFVVLKGASQGRAFIADPTRGNLRVPLYDLFDEWSGETLIVGRDGFGLPQKHKLSTPKGRNVAPEERTTRALQTIRVN
ncbi:C39 family peptidase [Desulfovibrio gilichinskyi]|nr:cysteine peptidase family C39 domain-containing protein [Desulfovibrio gilichinskyi]